MIVSYVGKISNQWQPKPSHGVQEVPPTRPHMAKNLEQLVPPTILGEEQLLVPQTQVQANQELWIKTVRFQTSQRKAVPPRWETQLRDTTTAQCDKIRLQEQNQISTVGVPLLLASQEQFHTNLVWESSQELQGASRDKNLNIWFDKKGNPVDPFVPKFDILKVKNLESE